MELLILLTDEVEVVKTPDLEFHYCAGACGHSVLYHVANFPNAAGEYDKACTKMDCGCMKFVEPKKAKDVNA